MHWPQKRNRYDHNSFISLKPGSGRKIGLPIGPEKPNPAGLDGDN